MRASLAWKVGLLIKPSNDGRRIVLSQTQSDVARRLAYFVEVYQFDTHLSPTDPSILHVFQSDTPETNELNQNIHMLAGLLGCSTATAIVAARVVALAASSYNTNWMLCVVRLRELLYPEQEDAQSSYSSNSMSTSSMSTSSNSSSRANSLRSNLFSWYKDISPMPDEDEKHQRKRCENMGVLALVRKEHESKKSN